ncbi:MAG: FAD-dependent oxidoreductase [Candidatus Obscuribacterales bacterium]|nr:FAD-dependent oxidoreductase [Candidatus Obscuribacterales bacterium]
MTEAKTYRVLDVESVQAENSQAIRQFQVDAATLRQETYDIAIIGGGMGGLAAALTILRLNANSKVLLVEETSWLGGQMTSQGVSALDENKYIESTGGCASYLELRRKIREYYQNLPELCPQAKEDPLLHPGLSWVTRLSFEPKVAIDIIDELFEPFLGTGNLQIKKRTLVLDAQVSKERQPEENETCTIDSIILGDLDSGAVSLAKARIFIDASELGDLFPLVGAPYRLGSDSKSETGEAHAPEQGDSDNVQDFTYPFVLTRHPPQDHTIAKPNDYDRFLAEGKFSLFGFKIDEEYDGIDPRPPEQGGGKAKHFLPFWTYRRLLAAQLFSGKLESDVSMINWDANDLRGYNIIDKEPEVKQDYLALAKRLSLGFLYWLQTEAARDDSEKKGYPEFKLDLDVLGTKDGLSKYPYIRESRRLKARTLIVEQDIAATENSDCRARNFADTVGIGLYPIDIHGRQEVPGAGQEARPFQIPYGSLVCASHSNLIAAAKNTGVSHITNGAYRLHPIEWATGVAAGAAAVLTLKEQSNGLSINMIGMPNYQSQLLQLQQTLIELGSPLFWLDDIGPSHPRFVEAQKAILTGDVTLSSASLSFAAAHQGLVT